MSTIKKPTSITNEPITTSESITDKIIPEPPSITIESVINPNVKINKDKELSPQLKNLIEEAKKRNEIKSDIELPKLVKAIQTNSARVMQILKNHGMDSQQAEKALTALLTLE